MTRKKSQGFTLIELLTVMVIIAILASLVLSIYGFVQNKQARSKAEAEIQAISTALENYKVDNAAYPRSTQDTDKLDPRLSGDPSATEYQNASLVLYRALSGDTDCNGKTDTQDGKIGIDGNAISPVPASPVAPKIYYEFKPYMLSGTKDSNGNITKVNYMTDPFGYSYGYSTYYQADIDAGQASPTNGYNPTFDLWSTAGKKSAPTPGVAGDATLRWIKNW